jgi:hypothetical protein
MKIKIIFLIVFILIIASGAQSCTEKDNWVPKGMKKITTDAVDYTMFVPESWTADISTGVVSAYVSSTDRSNVTMMASNLANENASMSLSDYWNKYEAKLLQTFPDMKYDDATGTEETETTDTGSGSYVPVSAVLGGSAANKYIYTASVTGTTYKYMQLICIRNGYAYIFTYTALPEKFDSHLEDVERIIEYFSFD